MRKSCITATVGGLVNDSQMRANNLQHPDWVGSRAKIDRSKRHFHELHAAIAEFFALNPYQVFIKHDENSSIKLWKVRIDHDVPVDVSLIIGDLIHNLRSSLDYMAWQLEIANGQTPDARTSFPVYDPRVVPGSPQHTSLENRKAEHRRRFRDRAYSVVEQLQPSGGVNLGDVDLHPLMLIHGVDIRDKHHLPNVVGGAVAHQDFAMGTTGGIGYIEQMVIGGVPQITVPLQNGTILSRISIGPDTRGIQMGYHHTFHIAFELESPGKGAPVIEVCDGLIRYTEQALESFIKLYDQAKNRRVRIADSLAIYDLKSFWQNPVLLSHLFAS